MRVTSCYITLYYMIGFSYMMMRRYTDAVRALTLSTLSRNPPHSLSTLPTLSLTALTPTILHALNPNPHSVNCYADATGYGGVRFQ